MAERIDSTVPAGERVEVAFFGRRNAGKSSLLNAIAGQTVSIVSAVPGTTTDPVRKTMEILPLGPCTLIDTAGLDDEGSLGEMRVKRTGEILARADVAVIVVAADCAGATELEDALARDCAARAVPVVRVVSKADLDPEGRVLAPAGAIRVSALRKEGVDALRAAIAAAAPSETPRPLLADLVTSGDTVVCVCPIDKAAPKGRLILPQQQAIRELLDAGCTAVATTVGRLDGVLKSMPPVRFVVTDSQAFEEVREIVPSSTALTSFSILFARAKGDLSEYCAGVEAMRKLKDGDLVLVAEGCTHRRQCGDIGSVKIPRWLEKFTGRHLEFEFASGNSFADFSLSARRPALVIHCGGCMLTRRAVLSRIAACRAAGVPIVNYGIAIAAMHGISVDPVSVMVR